MRNRTEDKISVVFIRHGRTAANNERRYIGKTDEGLTYDGADELLSVRDNAEEPDEVFSSPMKRCLQTVRVIFGNVKPVIINDWAEMDFGSFEYKNYEELKDDPAYQAWIDSNGELPIPNGESGLDFRQRCCNAYERCIAAAQAQSREKIAIVCHGGTIMSVMERYGVPQKSFYEWQISNGCGILTELIEGEKKGYGMREISKWE